MQVGIIIRPAKLADLEAIQRLEIEVWGECSNSYDLALFIGSGASFVAEDASGEARTFAGVILCSFDGGGAAWVAGWAVQDGWRKRGVGRLLYGEVFKAAPRIIALVDVNNEVSQAAHRRLGFSQGRPFKLDADVVEVWSWKSPPPIVCVCGGFTHSVRCPMHCQWDRDCCMGRDHTGDCAIPF